MSSEEKTGSPPLYPTYAANPQSYQQYPLGPLSTAPPPMAPMGTVGGTVPAEEVHHHDSNDKKKKKEELEELGEVDPASLIPGKGPGGAPQQYFNVSSIL